MIEHREQFIKEIREIPPHKLVFIDETGSHIAMTPEYARAPLGERAIGYVPRNRGTVTTVIGGLARRGLTALMDVEGGTSTDVFLDFVCEHLLPTLRRGDVVVMDNLAAHRAAVVRRIIEGRGARVLFTPTYSVRRFFSDADQAKRANSLRDLKAGSPCLCPMDSRGQLWYAIVS